MTDQAMLKMMDGARRRYDADLELLAKSLKALRDYAPHRARTLITLLEERLLSE